MPQLVAAGQVWATIASGWATVLAVRQDGTLWGWGENATGALGTPSYALEPLLIQAGSGLQLDRFRVYPNPTHGPVTIVSPGCSAPLVLFDLTGRQVRSLPPCTTTLEVQGLASGIYLLRQGTAVTRLAIE
ncbi:T9SS type A sorting domain-containing protein [Hymenobacter psoromatis]|uniref:T9SS type A sorting domain-containing protein n=1 Tax=Hymenobacter psoromatis TaxID=1484116 RepID=UPI001CBFF0D3